MNWIQRIDNIQLEIVTGDGKIFKPLWKDASKSVVFNTQAYDFVNIAGSYVSRKLKKGDNFPILLYFQGENHIEDTNKFLSSANDLRAWKIRHPLYDDVLVQPIELNIDNSIMNVSKITGVVIETITQEYPSSSMSPVSQVRNKKTQIDETVETNFPSSVSTETIDLAVSATDNISSNYTKFIDNEYIADFKDKVRICSSASQNISNSTTRYIQSVQDLINFPFQIEQKLDLQLNNMILSIVQLKNSILLPGTGNIFDAIKVYESNTVGILSASCVVAVDAKSSEYNTREQVLSIIDKILSGYEEILTTFDDNNQNLNHQVAQELDYIINTTIGNLYIIAFEQKQKRSILLENDDNIINLCHRFYGISEENLEKFIAENDITANEYIVIKKGRKIIWYV